MKTAVLIHCSTFIVTENLIRKYGMGLCLSVYKTKDIESLSTNSKCILLNRLFSSKEDKYLVNVLTKP